MVGAGGGRSVLTADLCEELGLSVPPLPADVERKVAEKAPDLAGWVTNPVDQSILAGSGLGGAQVLEWLDESPGDRHAGRERRGAVGVRAAERRGDRAARDGAVHPGRIAHVEAVCSGVGAIATTADEARWRLVSEARERLVEAGVAVFPSVERAVRTLAAFAGYWAGAARKGSPCRPAGPSCRRSRRCGWTGG